MADWCREHKSYLLVTLWPFLQELGPSDHYPFTKLHAMVSDQCRDLSLPILDLLPILKSGQPTSSYWVTPADMHANPSAQRLVRPAIAEFVRQNWPR